MSADWPEFQLGERCTVKSSKRIFANEYVDNGVPFMRSKDVIDKALGSFIDYDLYISEGRFSEIKKTHGSPIKGDLLMSSVGNRSGQPYVIQNEGDFHFKDGNILWLSEFIDINPDYLAYWFKSEIGQSALVSVMIGSAQKALTIDSIRKLWVKFPPIEYQNKAASILLSLDKKIKLSRQTNQTLENIAQAIFKSWFVDFEPTRAKIAAKQAGQDSERVAMAAISGKALEELDQLSSEQLEQLKETAALFPDEMVDSELGEVPEGWDFGKLESLCSLNKTSWTKKSAPNCIWYVDLANTKNGVIEETQYYSWEDAPSRARRILSRGDTIVGTVRPGNRSFSIIGDTDQQLTASTGFAVLTPLRAELTEFVFVAATSDENIDRLAHLADGGAYPAVKPDVVTSMDLVIPSDEVIDAFSKQAKSLFEKRGKNLETDLSLKNLRDTLLPKLLSGELEIPSKNREIA